MTNPGPDLEPDDQPDDDVYSPRTMRTLLTVGGLTAITLAMTVFHSWPRLAFIALAVIMLCAAITPPFRKPHL